MTTRDWRDRVHRMLLWHERSLEEDPGPTSPGRRFGTALLLGLALGGAVAHAQCGDNSPAVPAPECVRTDTAEPASCGAADTVRLWSSRLRPGAPNEGIPAIRDTTDRVGGLTVPGEARGHELFKAVAPVGDWLFVAYNAGIQAWRISGANAERPYRGLHTWYRDGWQGHFLSFPQTSEKLTYIEDIAAVPGGAGTLVAASGKYPVGPSFWEFNGSAFRPLYQDVGTATQQLRIADVGGTLYVLAADGGGIVVYDLSEASGFVSGCLDDRGSSCGDVFLGRVSTTTAARYLDAMVLGETLYVVSTLGSSDGVQLWEVDPAAHSGFRKYASGNPYPAVARGPALFAVGGDHYLAFVRRAIVAPKASRLEVYDIDDCLDADGCASLGAPVIDRFLHDRSADEEFLTFSQSADGTPFLYYGVYGAGASLTGPALEQLFDLSGLPASIEEVTAGGGSYVDPCNGKTIDYWGRYYGGNSFGLREVQPRMGKLHGDYFYRAGQTILDVHALVTPNTLPVAAFSWEPEEPVVGEDVVLSDGSVGVLSSRLWLLPADTLPSPTVAGDAAVTVHWDTAAERSIGIQVCSLLGCDTTTALIKVVDPPPPDTAVFDDDFETGDLTRWSGAMP